MSRLLLIISVILLLSCEQAVPGRGLVLEGKAAAQNLDSIFLYQVHGLTRHQLAGAPLRQQGDSVIWKILVDSLDKGWYYAGIAPNQLSLLYLEPGTSIRLRGTLTGNGLTTSGTSANQRWIQSELRFNRLSQEVLSTWKMAVITLEDGDSQSYVDYAAASIQAFSSLESWIDSMYRADPFLAGEYRLRLQPPYLPDVGTYTQQGAFDHYDAYLRVVLGDLDERAAVYPGLGYALEHWLELQRREETWASAEWRDQRIRQLLAYSSPGKALHEDLLAAVISTLDEWQDPLVADFAQEYLDLYEGSRRMEAYLEGRIDMIRERKQQEATQPRLYNYDQRP